MKKIERERIAREMINAARQVGTIKSRADRLAIRELVRGATTEWERDAVRGVLQVTVGPAKPVPLTAHEAAALARGLFLW